MRSADRRLFERRFVIVVLPRFAAAVERLAGVVEMATGVDQIAIVEAFALKPCDEFFRLGETRVAELLLQRTSALLRRFDALLKVREQVGFSGDQDPRARVRFPAA